MIIEIKQKVKTTEDEMNKNTKKVAAEPVKHSILSPNYSQKTPHNLPIRVRYGVSVMSSKSHLHSTLVIARSYVS